VSGQPAPRWWRRRRDLALASARDAQASATVALLELDTAQRSAFSHLDFLVNVDAGPIARRIRQAWAPVSAAADAAIHGYLEALERWDVTADLELEDASAAVAGFTAHGTAMQAVLADIAAFSEQFTPEFVSVTRTLEQLVPRRRAAEAAVQQAWSALGQAEAAGFLARRARALLGRALQHLEVVEAGPVVHGMDTVLHACGDAVAAAHEAAHDVEQLPERRQRVHNTTTSLRTRLAAVEWRAGRDGEQVLRSLRRGYVEGCWADLEDGSQRTATALDTARRELEVAEGAASDVEQRWDEALSGLARARTALDEAQAHVDGPSDRLALLESVAADPAAVHSRARFAVRDTQKLLMAGPVDPQHAAALDALAGRLDTTLGLLERRHPDWLAYAQSLDAIVDEARGLVLDIRASRAR